MKEIEAFARRWGADKVSFGTGASRTRREVIRDVDNAIRRRLSGSPKKKRTSTREKGHGAEDVRFRGSDWCGLFPHDRRWKDQKSVGLGKVPLSKTGPYCTLQSVHYGRAVWC